MLYRVIQTFDHDELLAFINANGVVDVIIEKVDLDQAARPKPAPAPRARKSKVNEAILEKLKDGPANIPALKTALIDAGMAAGSLSTGLAFLQKNGSIARREDGFYEAAQ
jgi:predicted Rossmann fold nucleotide-binding protein DprA/Smf involved in DNA uptake